MPALFVVFKRNVPKLMVKMCGVFQLFGVKQLA